MRIRFILVALVATIRVARTAPVTAPSQPVSIPPSDKPSYMESDVLFGKEEVDFRRFDYGQQSMWPGGSVSIVLNHGETAYLGVRPNGAPIVETNGVDSIPYHFMSNWRADAPSLHQGVKYTDTSDVFFRVGGYRISPDGGFGAEVSPRYIRQVAAHESSRNTIVLPASNDVRW